MECRHARLLMHEALDVGGAPAPALNAHLDLCTECAGRFERLTAVQRAVGAAVCAPVPGERLHDAVERARAVAEERRPRPAPGFAWAAAAVVFGLCAFGSGAWFGRSTWPREVTVVRTDVRPEVVERIVEKRVEVQVPVIQYRDRVVVRTVRVAASAKPGNRDRAGAVVLAGAAPSPTTMPMLDFLSLPRAVISQELAPARIVTPPPPTDAPTDKPAGASLLGPSSHSEIALAYVPAATSSTARR
jgi:hypothetical protein